MKALPAGWDILPVESMGDVRAGKALAAKGPGKQRPYLRTKNVFDGRIDIDDVLQMPMTDTEFARYRLRNGDVLLNEGQTIELVGRCSIYRDEYPEPCAIQNQLVRFRPSAGTSASFAAHLFRYCQQTGAFRKIALQTTSVAHLGVSRFARLQLGWPQDQLEQEAIAEALDDADTHIEAMEQLIAKKRAIKQGTMQELLTGRRRLPGFSKDWETLRLGQLGSFLKGKGVSRDDSMSGELPCIRYGEIYTHHNDYIRRFESWISRQVAENATRLKPGDILFAGSGETKEEIGKCVAFTEDVEAYAGGDIVILRPRAGDPAFWGYYLNTAPIVKQKASLGQGDAVVHVSASALSTVECTIPAPDEQAAISSILRDMDFELELLDARLLKARQVKKGMMQELLTGKTRLL